MKVIKTLKNISNFHFQEDATYALSLFFSLSTTAIFVYMYKKKRRLKER